VRETLRDQLSAGIPFLGICLGLQALFERSAEAPDARGLGIFPGSIERFPLEARVPHMGWNEVTLAKPSRLLDPVARDRYFYFAHSYFLPPGPDTTLACDYGVSFTAAFERDQIFGIQFHPEKSGPLGLALLRQFLQL
jgi:imidazole glycerol phosphate synthase glutamine amidotransferase subunit